MALSLGYVSVGDQPAHDGLSWTVTTLSWGWPITWYVVCEPTPDQQLEDLRAHIKSGFASLRAELFPVVAVTK